MDNVEEKIKKPRIEKGYFVFIEMNNKVNSTKTHGN